MFNVARQGSVFNDPGPRLPSLGGGLRDTQGGAIEHPNLALRKGNRDALGLERIPKREEHVAADIGEPRRRIVDPEAQRDYLTRFFTH